MKSNITIINIKSNELKKILFINVKLKIIREITPNSTLVNTELRKIKYIFNDLN